MFCEQAGKVPIQKVRDFRVYLSGDLGVLLRLGSVREQFDAVARRSGTDGSSGAIAAGLSRAGDFVGVTSGVWSRLASYQYKTVRKHEQAPGRLASRSF